MGRKLKPDAHRTGLQRRLATEVRAGMAASSRSQADLSRETGIGEPHISLLLRGLRQGTISAWDKLLRAAHGSGASNVVGVRGDSMTIRGGTLIAPPQTFVDELENIADTLNEAAEIPQALNRPRRPVSSLNPRRPA